MEECAVGLGEADANFEELRQEMSTDIYWIRFFVRPCCPAPDMAGAEKMLNHLKSDVQARDDFSDEQKRELCGIIDDRLVWYPTSGLCRQK